MYKTIYLNDSFSDYITSPDDTLSNLKRINLFIGQNNSGKSRFMRKLLMEPGLEFSLSNPDFTALHEEISASFRELFLSFKQQRVKDVDGILAEFNKIAQRINRGTRTYFDEWVPMVYHFGQKLKEFTEIQNVVPLNPSGPSRHHEFNLVLDIKRTGDRIYAAIDKIFLLKSPLNFNGIYIPILRGLRPPTGNASDIYSERTKNDYFGGNTSSDTIFTGLKLYDEVKRKLLGTKEDRDLIRRFEEFLSRVFFNAEPITLIPQHNSDVLLVGIGDDERSIQDLGDGIQAIITLLYPMFTNIGSYQTFFIEEPEFSLHPGLQRIFLETLMIDEFSSFQFFISTHSNHFLDIAIDIDSLSIYSFSKNTGTVGKFTIENASQKDARILELLGVRNSSVFLSNCSIWVEGITDRLYLKKYLEVYQNYLVENDSETIIWREDINYSFIEYAGGNLVHWSFEDSEDIEKINVSAIANKFLLIADSDKTENRKEGRKAARLKDLENKLGESFIVIDGVEIENTLSSEILISTVKSLEKENSEVVEYEPGNILFETYQYLQMGVYIEESFKNLEKKYKAESGTVLHKLDFCKNAVSHIKKYEDLSPEGKRLAEKIYQFIKKANT